MKSPTHMANDGLAVRVDELRRSEKSLRSQTDILQSILDSMAAGVIVADQDGKLLLSNPAAQHLSGNDPNQVSLSNPRCAINPSKLQTAKDKRLMLSQVW
jgi:PAS domain S-box-containing protein